MLEVEVARKALIAQNAARIRLDGRTVACVGKAGVHDAVRSNAYALDVAGERRWWISPSEHCAAEAAFTEYASIVCTAWPAGNHVEYTGVRSAGKERVDAVIILVVEALRGDRHWRAPRKMSAINCTPAVRKALDVLELLHHGWQLDSSWQTNGGRLVPRAHRAQEERKLLVKG
jgi:hypothetical protein